MLYKKVFIYYPRGKQTGGPEALHQLASELRLAGIPSFMVPIRGTQLEPRVDAYRHFGIPEVDEIDDDTDCAVVVPEMALSSLRQVRHAVKFCWWLSVDNSELLKAERKLSYTPTQGVRNRLKRVKHRFLVPVQRMRTRSARLDGMIHLTQSQYAWASVYSRFDIVPSMLSDYTNIAEITSEPRLEVATFRIAYNPAKGGDLVLQVIESARGTSNWEWVPIQGMNRQEVIRTLRSSSVYLDLGHHPGKDRLPREAAVAGAVALVARRGAGAFAADLQVPWEHKIDMNNIVLDAERALRLVAKDISGQLARQETYRSVIAQERKRFGKEVADIFVQGRLGADTYWPGVDSSHEFG